MAIDQGHDLVSGDPLRRGDDPRRLRTGGISPALPGLRLGRARPERPLVDHRRRLPGRARRERAFSATDVAAIGITNQRETDRGLGRRHRRAALQRHRLAGPPHRRPSAGRCARRGTRRPITRATRPCARPVFLRDEAQVHPRRDRRPATAPHEGEVAPFGTVRHPGCIWKLTGGKVHATDATNACRTIALTTSRPATGRTRSARFSTFPARCSPRSATATANTASRVLNLFGREIPHSRRRGRPAGGDDGPGLVSSRE